VLHRHETWSCGPTLGPHPAQAGSRTAAQGPRGRADLGCCWATWPADSRPLHPVGAPAARPVRDRAAGRANRDVLQRWVGPVDHLAPRQPRPGSGAVFGQLLSGGWPRPEDVENAANSARSRVTRRRQGLGGDRTRSCPARDETWQVVMPADRPLGRRRLTGGPAGREEHRPAQRRRRDPGLRGTAVPHPGFSSSARANLDGWHA